MKLSEQELKTIVATYVAQNKISNPTFNVTRENTAFLVDKIGKTFTFDTSYVDKLSMFDGEMMGMGGRTIEEWQEDLILPVDYDPNGATTLAPHNPTYRPNFYSYTLGKKVIPTTIYGNDLERAVNNEGEFVSLVSMKTKRLSDSEAVWRYAVKREGLAKLYAMANVTNASVWSAVTTHNVGDFVKESSSATDIYEVVKPTPTGKTFVDAKSEGYVIKLDLITKIAKPSDTATGENFIEQVKKDVEIASDISEGHSINANTLGATEGLILLVKQGVIPNLEVKTFSGAFQKEDIAIPTKVVVVKDFGSASDVYACLIDSRIMRLYPSYKAVKDQYNAEANFQNLFLHTENTMHISRNCFVKFYKNA